MEPGRIETIRENLTRVQDRISAAANSVGRQPDEVRLVVVSKGQPAEVLQAAAQAGATIFGENYAEEASEKIEQLGGKLDVEWHMIGHVQSRKARLVVAHFDLVHSVDSVKLAEKYNQLLAEINQRMKVLLELNVGGEGSKSGWFASDPGTWKDLIPEINRIVELPNLEICGLMTMPPLFEDAQKTRPYFRKLRSLRDYLSKYFPAVSFQELSMGTSADFEAAVQEGATFVRVGQAILGPRIKQGNAGRQVISTEQ